jgi:hypothetical protein
VATIIASLLATVGIDSRELTKGLNEAKKELEGTSKQVKETAKNFDFVKTAAVSLAVTGFAMIIGEVKAAVDETARYAKSSLDLASALGITQQEAQKLIQVSDDVGISVSQLSTAFEMATKKGFQPTVENLATLADKTNAMADPTERATYLAGIFGRGWANISPLLEKGGNSIRAAADEAQNMGLILDDKANAAAETFRQNLDTLNDTLTGVKYTIGSAVIPVINDLITLTKGASSQTDLYEQALAALRLRYGENSTQVKDLTDRYKAHNDAVGIVTDKTVLAARAAAELPPPLKQTEVQSKETAKALKEWAESTKAGSESSFELSKIIQDDLNKALQESTKEFQAYFKTIQTDVLGINDYAKSETDLAKKQKDLQTELAKLTRSQGAAIYSTKKSVLSDNELLKAKLDLAKVTEDLTLKQRKKNESDAEFNARMQGLVVTADKLTGKIGETSAAVTGYVDNSKKIKEVTASLKEVENQIEANKQAHIAATKQFVLDSIEQRLAADGVISDKEQEALIGIARGFGLIDDNTVAALRSANALSSAYLEGKINEDQLVVGAINLSKELANWGVSTNVTSGIIAAEREIAKLHQGVVDFVGESDSMMSAKQNILDAESAQATLHAGVVGLGEQTNTRLFSDKVAADMASAIANFTYAEREIMKLHTQTAGLGSQTNTQTFASNVKTDMTNTQEGIKIAIQAAMELYDSINKLQSKEIHVKTFYEEITQKSTLPPQQGPGYASGANFIVPPGYPNDTFPMRVQSGERVIVQPAAEASKSDSGSGVTINNTINAAPGMDANALAAIVSQRITRQLRGARAVR